jgi:hypothetical protein
MGWLAHILGWRRLLLLLIHKTSWDEGWSIGTKVGVRSRRPTRLVNLDGAIGLLRIIGG